MKKQIVYIHGGDTFTSYDEYMDFIKSFEIEGLEYTLKKRWKNSLQTELGDNFEVIMPEMPNKINAHYEEWKIWFEKFIPFLRSGVILIGHSLGGIFLAKYLSENTFPLPIAATFLIAAPFDDKDSEYKLADFNFQTDLKKFENQGGKIFIYHSTDDDVVPYVDSEKYAQALPSATPVTFSDRKHFNQPTFPEIILNIKDVS